MSRIRLGGLGIAGAIVIAFCWLLNPAAAEAKGKNKDNKAERVHGKVVAVTVGKDGSGSITIATHAKKVKKGTPPAAGNAKKTQAETKTIQIGPNTVYETVSSTGKTQVTLVALHRGETVTVLAGKGPADEIDINVGKKPRKAKKGIA